MYHTINIVETPQKIFDSIQIKPYIIKIKCLACSETKFLPYVEPVIKNGTLYIGSSSFPLDLIEKVTVRHTWEYEKEETVFKVNSLYFRQFLNEEAKQKLKEFEAIK